MSLDRPQIPLSDDDSPLATRHSPLSSEAARYVGTLVGESTSREFRLAVAHDTVREQDIVVVDAEVSPASGARPPERTRVWAKVQRIERLNPLFPGEAGHEVAAARIDPFDTVLSLTREIVTAVCQVLGAEPLDGGTAGKLDHLRYPPRPASSAYRPDAAAIGRVVFGDLSPKRALDIATLSNRPEVDVSVDGHAIVTRHLAILAMTGAGKSWTARRIVEGLAAKNYPIVIFDPHGDYSRLAEVEGLHGHVALFYADLPIFEETADDAALIICSLSSEEMTAPQRDAFDALFSSASRVLDDGTRLPELRDILFRITDNPYVKKYPLRKDLFALSYVADAVAALARGSKEREERVVLANIGLEAVLQRADARSAPTFGALARQLRRAGVALRDMQNINRRRAGAARPLPPDRTGLVGFDQIAVVTLAGYSDVLQATLYTLIARSLFKERTRGKLRFPYLMVLEEAHNFVPGRAEHPALDASIAITKQIAQEGRKFNVGLVLISQRPSRLDETTLSQCNSYVVMRMVNPADQNYVRRVVETLGEDEARMLPDLDVGEAILSGQFVNLPMLVKMKEPRSRGEHEEQDAFDALEEARRRVDSL